MINLEKVFRDAGFMLWPNVFCSMLRIPDYPLSSKFGYTIITRTSRIAALGNLRIFEYRDRIVVLSVNSTLV